MKHPENKLPQNPEKTTSEHLPDWEKDPVPSYEDIDEFKESVRKMKEHNEESSNATDLEGVDLEELDSEAMEVWNEFAQIANGENISSDELDIIDKWKKFDFKDDSTAKAFVAFVRNKVMNTEVWNDYWKDQINP